MFKHHFPAKCLPVIRMNQLVPLQKLFMLETFPTFVADKTPPIVMFCLLMIHYRTGMIQHLPTYVTRVAFLNLLFLQNLKTKYVTASQKTSSEPTQVRYSQHTKYLPHIHTSDTVRSESRCALRLQGPACIDARGHHFQHLL